MAYAVERQSGIAFRLKRRFEAPRSKVFEAWTKPEVLKQWWCPEGWKPGSIDLDLRVGGAFEIKMYRASGGVPVVVRGVFEEVRVPERLSYTWQWENAFEEMPETRVTVEFVEIAGATELILMHEYLPEISVCLQHRAGWIAALDRMYAATRSRTPRT